jgi:glycerol-3-phosphate dehydrogenase (NAD(P)+)
VNFIPKVVGIIGSGSFGTTVARLISHNASVLLLSRNETIIHHINHHHRHLDIDLPTNIKAIPSIEHLCKACQVIFPIVPSTSFREVIKDCAEYLHPDHILIHGTKGFDIINVDYSRKKIRINRSNIRTMSEVIREESSVIRIGALTGPNLSSEIMRGLPAASVVASRFDEVINIGNTVLSSPLFKIYGSHDIIGAELAGALKNMIAVGTGIIEGVKLGKNVEALFITRGLREMLLIGNAMEADFKTFFGVAGVGDLIATATSKDSRNFTFGYQLAMGRTKEEIEKEFDELAEGVRTIQFMFHLAQFYKLDVPIVEMLYAVIYHELPLNKAISYLLEYPYSIDVDYIN